MPSLNPVSKRELVRKLKALGFEGPFPGGKHQWMHGVVSVSRFPIHMGRDEYRTHSANSAAGWTLT